MTCLKNVSPPRGTSLVTQWLKTPLCNAGDMGSGILSSHRPTETEPRRCSPSLHCAAGASTHSATKTPQRQLTPSAAK